MDDNKIIADNILKQTTFLICKKLFFFSTYMIMEMVMARIKSDINPLPRSRNVDKNSEASV